MFVRQFLVNYCSIRSIRYTIQQPVMKTVFFTLASNIFITLANLFFSLSLQEDLSFILSAQNFSNYLNLIIMWISKNGTKGPTSYLRVRDYIMILHNETHRTLNEFLLLSTTEPLACLYFLYPTPRNKFATFSMKLTIRTEGQISKRAFP